MTGRIAGALAALILALDACAGAAQVAPAELSGAITQGGTVFGKTEPGAAVTLDGRPVRVAADGRFVFGFGRDAPYSSLLELRRSD